MIPLLIVRVVHVVVLKEVSEVWLLAEGLLSDTTGAADGPIK